MAGRVITISNDTDFLRQSGPIFVEDLRTDASLPSASDTVRRDWSIIATWLDHTTGDWTSVQRTKVEKAWIAYLSIGLAPSDELQPGFAMFAEQLKGTNKADRAPTEVMDVFDRLLASEADIERKRAADLKASKAQLQPLLDKLNKKRQPRWWRRQSPTVRRWIFGAVVWAALMAVLFSFFDPFDTGGWDRMNDEEMMRFYLIVFAPVAAGAVYYAYRKWVR